MLLDCGEGAWQALQLSLGPHKAQATIERLAAVFVSHRHADHCLGLPAVLQARPARMPPLLLVVPAAVQTWLQEAYSHLISRVQFTACADFTGGHFVSTSGGTARAGGRPGVRGCKSGAAAAAMQRAGFVAWTCPRVRHCYDAFGIVLEHRHGWKLVFSGDTMRCAALQRLGQGATLLIHEATFDNDRHADAAGKRHSTLGGALAAAQAMGAWRLLLTHFSQRYSRYAPDLTALCGDAAAQAAAGRAAPAFDGMLVPFTALHSLPAVGRAMAEFLTESCCNEAEARWEERVRAATAAAGKQSADDHVHP